MNVTLCKRCGAESQAWSGRCEVCGGTEAVSVSAQPDKLLGRTIHGRFKLTKKLGQGGMGTVYEAEDLKLGQRAALKFLNADMQTVDLAKRFLVEARTVARVQHPGAVCLLDFGREEDGTLFIALELVDGVTLKALLDDRRRLPLNETVDIVLQVASALGHAHEMGVVHRDMKPENVMVKPALHGFHVKLLDFGVARRTYAGATQLTQQGAIAGTPRYMSPEQVRGEDVDGRVDIYALGLLTFELLTGVPAMDAPDLDAMMAQQLRGGVRPLSAVDPALANPAVDAVLSKATHKNRDERYGTMASFALAPQAATLLAEHAVLCRRRGCLLLRRLRGPCSRRPTFPRENPRHATGSSGPSSRSRWACSELPRVWRRGRSSRRTRTRSLGPLHARASTCTTRSCATWARPSSSARSRHCPSHPHPSRDDSWRR